MNILGMGIVFAGGVGVSSFESALRNGWRKPADVETTRVSGEKSPAYQVDLDAAPDKTLLKKIRRSDKLSKMSVLAAAEALADSGTESIDRTRLGVIAATAFGAHVTTFAFLDNILDFGDAAVSPTTFSNSVHNAAASYISSSLDINGPTLTVTQFRFSFPAALQLAQAWLDQGRCEHVLVGGADQFGDVLGYVSNHKLTIAPDGRIKPFLFKPTCQVPGEGAVFFLLSGTSARHAYCAIEAVRINDAVGQGGKADLDIISADGMLVDESAYLSSLSPAVPVAAYSPLFGSMMIGNAFNIAAGALMLKRQTRYATPVRDNPHGILLLGETKESPVDSIRCADYNCYAEKAVIALARA